MLFCLQEPSREARHPPTASSGSTAPAASSGSTGETHREIASKDGDFLPASESDSDDDTLKRRNGLLDAVAMEVLEDLNVPAELIESMLELTMLPNGRVRLGLHLFLGCTDPFFAYSHFQADSLDLLFTHSG